MAKNILIVEDNTPTRELIAGLVKSAGHNAIEAADGYRALELVEEYDIHAGLFDQYMEPMGGFQLAERLIFEDKKMPLLLITAHDKSDILLEARDKGFMAVMKKPIDPDRFLKTLERLLKLV